MTFISLDSRPASAAACSIHTYWHYKLASSSETEGNCIRSVLRQRPTSNIAIYQTGEKKLKLSKSLLSPASGVLLILAACSANAGDGQGKIVQMAINKNIGAAAFVRLDTAPVGSAACSTNGYWHFTIPLVSDLDKRLYAQLLAAKLANATVTISGAGGCGEYGSVESAVGVGLL